MLCFPEVKRAFNVPFYNMVTVYVIEKLPT